MPRSGNNKSRKFVGENERETQVTYVGRKKVRRRLRALDHPAAPSPVVDPRSTQISLGRE
jgi:hypothetical protein